MLCTILPYLPGRYEKLAEALWLMAQLGAKAALVLVPIGAFWWVAERSSAFRSKRHYFAIAAVVASSLVCAITLLAAWGEGGFIFAFFTAALWLGAILLLSPRLKQLTRSAPGPKSWAPVYLVVVPIVATLFQAVIADPIAAFGRGRAIANSAPMIADIEQYRATHGRYPTSMLSVWNDYRPSVIGVEGYRYEPSGDAYNLVFNIPSFRIGTREFVVYNPRDEQVMTSHDSDLLRRTPEELSHRRGFYAAMDLPHPHWKSFLFD